MIAWTLSLLPIQMSGCPIMTNVSSKIYREFALLDWSSKNYKRIVDNHPLGTLDLWSQIDRPTNSLKDIRTYARTHARTYVQCYICTYALSHVRPHARRHARMHACTPARTHARMHARTHARTHAGTHARTHAFTDARTHACTYVRIPTRLLI